MATPSRSLLLDEIRACTHCAQHLPYPPRPVLQASEPARLLILSQAPGRKVQDTGIPWNDPSGDRLREWLQIPAEQFYDAEAVALVPMGFCYPGRGASGDAPPRPECAQLWHHRLLGSMPQVRLTLLVGRYAQTWALGQSRAATLTETVASFRDYLPRMLPLPHPSPRNRAWLKGNPWFEKEVLPELRLHVTNALRP